jgi:hypothetical protein
LQAQLLLRSRFRWLRTPREYLAVLLTVYMKVADVPAPSVPS